MSRKFKRALILIFACVAVVGLMRTYFADWSLKAVNEDIATDSAEEYTTDEELTLDEPENSDPQEVSSDDVVASDEPISEEHRDYTITVLEDHTSTTDLADEAVPLAASPAPRKGWGFIDLLLTAACCVLSALILILKHSRSRIACIAAVLIAAVSVVIFLTLSDFGAGILPAGPHAVLIAELFAAELIVLIFTGRKTGRAGHPA